MRIFNSVGSNYNFWDAIRFVFSYGSQKHSDELAAFLAARYGGSSQLYYRGRGALAAGLTAAGVAGKDVVVTGYTCYAVEQAANAAGANVHYADVTKNGYNFGLANLKKTVTKNTRAVIVQNTYGLSIDITSVEQYCRENDIVLIEDLAHSLGSYYPDGREVGTVGDITMLSFGRDKHIDVVNGGALIIRSSSIVVPKAPHNKAPLLARIQDRLYPGVTWKTRATYNMGIGRFYFAVMRKMGVVRMASSGSVMEEAILPSYRAKAVTRQFKDLELQRLRRREIAELYGLDVPEHVNLLRAPFYVSNKAAFIKEAQEAGFNLHDTWYDCPVYPKRYMQDSVYTPGSCPNAEYVSKNVVTLPLHKNISKRKAVVLAKVLEKYV